MYSTMESLRASSFGLLVLGFFVCSFFTTTTLAQLEPAATTLPQVPTLSECLELNDNNCIPRVGLGTSRIGSTDEEVVQAIKDGIDVGYRHIDTAHFYQNEKAIGQALEELIKEGKVQRNELFITTKVWSNHHTKDLALLSVRRSLEDLRLDYLDLVLVHWPMSFPSGGELVPKFPNGTVMSADLTKENFEMAYQGLEEAKQQNLTRSIGVSNFNVKQLEKLLAVDGRKKPTVNQVECHPYLNQQELLEFCNNKGIRLEAYSPLRRGDSQLLEEEKLKQIAQKHNRTVAQVILRWQLQRDVIVIPRSSKKQRMIENRSLFDFHLDETEMEQIMSLNKNNGEGRVIKWETATHLPEYPFH